MSNSQNYPTLHKLQKRESAVSSATDNVPLTPLNRNEGKSQDSLPLRIYVRICTIHKVHRYIPQYITLLKFAYNF